MTDFSFPDLRVLVAEDSAPVRLVLKTYLGKLGIRPSFAEDGREALSLLSEKHFDMAFMDVHMPEMDGTEVVTEIRKKGMKIPVIAMTTGDNPNLLTHCLECGYNGILLKPIMKEDVFRKVKEFLPTV
ncbi:response regulator [Maridesulfovibrio salexigens]|uniref:Response regulator receiver protein n=1 Tax=Maridesulfovibrio salexigens (strain ATCC 14822 / DSM 2638 / NCIMB 8403 / VKM B-1763) TaxID=526222 RepID=C6BZL6_MARSD|nr:response regulator [Maridesulfovibrio salexigens]ACS78923.1 response regulator receiver protein [Maridesulfovibrio salexigens DSM 2638]